MNVLRQREPRYENRRLLDVAHDAPCMLQLGAPCGNYPSVPCHSDQLKHGRGTGHKSHDCFAVPGCPDCHLKFTREHLTRSGYEDIFQLALERYLLWMWATGKIGVIK